jgi:hypothetical protein
MTSEAPRRGRLDTSIMSLRSRIAPEDLPGEMAISAVTLAELSAGPHEVRPDTERARRGRKPRRRAADLMFAATAIVAGLPLYTTNPDDFVGLDHLVTVIPVTRPEVPNERRPGQ